MPEVSPHLVAELKRLEEHVMGLEANLNVRERELRQAESRLRQGIAKTDNVQSLEANLKRNMGNFLVPGNVGDINKVVWPFWFTTAEATVGPDQNIRTQFSITQEAGFVWMSYAKAIYDLDTVTNDITYIDPNGASPQAPGLSYLIRDAQSSREFFNKPQNVDSVGNPRFPSVLPTPQFFLPNSTIEVNFINNHPTNTYIAFLTFFGYRLRVENGKNILSTIYG